MNLSAEQLLQIERQGAAGLKDGIATAVRQNPELVHLLLRSALRAVVEQCFEQLPEAEALELLGVQMSALTRERGH